MRALSLLAMAALGCQADVDYGGTSFQCSDGETCPPGFRCEGQRCVAGDAGGGDAETGRTSADAAPDEVDMVSIPAGEFAMGCDQDDCPLDAGPVHTVYISAFEIDRVEVTGAAYAACVEAGDCTESEGSGSGDQPIAGVTWLQAQAFCAWRGARLPTEAEWEKAARGADGRAYPWGDSEPTCDEAITEACADAPQAVGARAAGASPYGGLDMAGNIAEWVADRYDADYYEDSPDSDPAGPAEGSARVVRGGSFDDDAEDVRTFARDSESPGNAEPEIGFRCAR